MVLVKIWHRMCAIISKLFYKVIWGSKFIVGKGTTWRRCLSIMISQNGKIIIGKNCFFNNFCSINSNDLITIGSNTIFGENVKIYDHNHKFANANSTIKEQGFSNGEVHIGDNCWIGSNVVILKGANIGDHCVIGAGCVVSSSIPDNTVVKCANNFNAEKIRS